MRFGQQPGWERCLGPCCFPRQPAGTWGNQTESREQGPCVHLGVRGSWGGHLGALPRPALCPAVLVPIPVPMPYSPPSKKHPNLPSRRGDAGQELAGGDGRWHRLGQGHRTRDTRTLPSHSPLGMGGRLKMLAGIAPLLAAQEGVFADIFFGSSGSGRGVPMPSPMAGAAPAPLACRAAELSSAPGRMSQDPDQATFQKCSQVLLQPG